MMNSQKQPKLLWTGKKRNQDLRPRPRYLSFEDMCQIFHQSDHPVAQTKCSRGKNAHFLNYRISLTFREKRAYVPTLSDHISAMKQVFSVL